MQRVCAAAAQSDLISVPYLPSFFRRCLSSDILLNYPSCGLIQLSSLYVDRAAALGENERSQWRQPYDTVDRISARVGHRNYMDSFRVQDTNLLPLFTLGSRVSLSSLATARSFQ